MIDPHDEAHWDVIHEKNHAEDAAHNTYAEEREKDFPVGSKICELGGGTGEDSLYFLRKGHKVYLFDISEFALRKAIERAQKFNLEKNLTTRQLDFGYKNLPLPDASMDIAYSRISLNYFPSQRTIEIFADIYRVLKKGGSAYLTFKSPEDEAEMKRLRSKASLFEDQVYIDGKQLRSRFAKEKLEEMLVSAGIVNAKVVPHRERFIDKNTERILYVNEVIFTKQA